MTPEETLAARLRQAVQGCSCHIHGPVHAWDEIQRVGRSGALRVEEVARLAVEACERRIGELRDLGAREEDPRVRKEELTRRFIEKLLA